MYKNTFDRNYSKKTYLKRKQNLRKQIKILLTIYAIIQFKLMIMSKILIV